MFCHSGDCGYDTPDHAIGYAMHSSRSHDAVIRVYDAAGKVIEPDKHKGDFKTRLLTRCRSTLVGSVPAGNAEIGLVFPILR